MLAQFRRFVVPEDQDYRIYQYPSAYDVKLAKETSRKEGKYGNMQLPESNDDDNSSDQ